MSDRGIGGASMPDNIRIEKNRLMRALVREPDQAKCDEIEAKIQEIEAQFKSPKGGGRHG